MKNKILGVCDADLGYMERFTEYLNRKEQFPFSVLSFTSIDNLNAYTKTKRVDILLISGNLMGAGISKLNVGKVVALSEGDLCEGAEDYIWIYKYQSLESIIRQLMEFYYEENKEQPTLYCKTKAFTIGVFSPVNRCYKTSFALILGQLCSKDEATLYLNLEEYSGFSTLLRESYEGDLSDVFFYYRQNKQLIQKIHTLVYSLGDLDYIPPVRCPEDLAAFSCSETAELIGELGKTGGYKTIIVDIGTGGREAVEILEVCDLIYMPVKEDLVSISKIAAYEDYLNNSGRDYIMRKTRKLELPQSIGSANQGNYIEQLLWGELGDYVRNLMKGKLWKEDGII